MLRSLFRRVGFHPRALVHGLLTYPRFLGTIKPELMRSREAEMVARLRSLDSRWQVRSLEPPIGRRLLVVAPHPDDETIGPGGLLLAHRGRSAVHLLNVFVGEGGGALAGRDAPGEGDYDARLRAARREELEAAARTLDARSVECLDLDEGVLIPSEKDVAEYRRRVEALSPDVVLLPWFLDYQPGHRATNLLHAWACGDLECMVLGYEIWTLCQPNAVFDVTDQLEEKIEMVRRYETQNTGIDYAGYVRGLARTRAFHYGGRPDRGGAVEAFLSLPNRDYCDLVRSLYGPPGSLSAEGKALLEGR